MTKAIIIQANPENPYSLRVILVRSKKAEALCFATYIKWRDEGFRRGEDVESCMEAKGFKFIKTVQYAPIR